VNRRYLERTGSIEIDLKNRLISEIFSPEDNQYLKKIYDATVANKAPYHTETRTKNGDEVVYLDTTLVPVFVDGVCTNIIGVSRDATERIRNNEALKKEKHRTENYLNIAAAMIVALDPVGNIQMLNRKGYIMLDYPEGSLTVRTILISSLRTKICALK
jgi:PAS domain S-box-containing protein